MCFILYLIFLKIKSDLKLIFINNTNVGLKNESFALLILFCYGSIDIFIVVRCFDDNTIVHMNGKVDSKFEIDVINPELGRGKSWSTQFGQLW